MTFADIKNRFRFNAWGKFMDITNPRTVTQLHLPVIQFNDTGIIRHGILPLEKTVFTVDQFVVWTDPTETDVDEYNETCWVEDTGETEQVMFAECCSDNEFSYLAIAKGDATLEDVARGILEFYANPTYSSLHTQMQADVRATFPNL